MNWDNPEMRKFQVGDKVLFYRNAFRNKCSREDWLGKIVTINGYDGKHSGEDKECYTVKEIFGYIVREDEICIPTKLHKVLL